MSFDWTNYIRLAEALEREAGLFSDEEACLRSAISRAYYGAFGLARDVAVSQDGLILSRSPKDHVRVIAHFRRSSQKTRRRIGLDLDRLRRVRNRADYEALLLKPKQTTATALRRAQGIERELDRL
ncbi:MAG: hypothetical protein GXP42_17465 [Chloroflexi bacterium]|nr:hypothetical protein [Chloroflexota bacterium]